MSVCKTEKPLRRSTPTSAVLFDLGNTLAAYYRRDEFQPILERAVDNILAELRARGIVTVDRESALAAAAQENREASDFCVTPLTERLVRIFGPWQDDSLADVLCERFLEPIFAIARVYDDVVPVLTQLRETGLRTAIVSKPAREIFMHAAAELGVDCRQCVFVGDELKWDVEGSKAVGMRPVLIDRDDRQRGFRGERIRDLRGVLKYCAGA